MRRNPLFCFSLLLLFLFPLLLKAQDAKIQALQDAIKSNPNDPTAHFNLGVSYLKQSQYDLAEPEFETCVRLNPNDSQSRELMESCLGISAFLKQDCSTAITHFQNVLKIKPDNKDIMLYLYQCQSKIAMSQKNYNGAEELEQQILDLKLNNDDANFNALFDLGVLNYQQKQYKEAVGYMEKAVLIQKDAPTYKYLGFSYYNLGNFNQAIENFKKSIEIETTKPAASQDVNSLDETYYNLAVAYYDNSLYDEAEDAFDHAFKLNPKDSNAAVGKAQAIDAAINAHMDKANGFLLNNRYSDAIAEWQKVLTYQPDAIINKQANDFIADAKKKLETEVEKHYQAGLKFQKNKDNLKALSEWNAALEMDPDNAEVKNAIASTKVANGEQVKALLAEGNELAAEKDYSGALAKYQMAKKVNPSSSTVQAKIRKIKALQVADLEKSLAVGKKKMGAGDLKSALEAMEAAYRIDPTNVEVKENLFRIKKETRTKVDSLLQEGDTLFASGDKVNAKSKYESVLSIDPNNEKANDQIQQMTGQQSQEKVDADKVKALYYEGVNNYINGNIHEAVQKWQDCLKLDPTNVNAKNNISKAMAKLQSIEQLSHN